MTIRPGPFLAAVVLAAAGASAVLPVLPAAAVTAALAGPAGAPGMWSAPVTVSRPATFLDAPFVGFGWSGRGLLAWGFQNGLATGGHSGSRAAPRGLDGVFGPELPVPGVGGPPVLYARDRAAVLTESDAGGRRRVGIAFGTTSGRFASPTTIAAFAPARGAPALAGNARGQLAVAYVQSLTGGRRSVTLVERRPGGRFGRPDIVAGRGQANTATVAVGPGGGLVVAWERDGRVFARVRPAVGRLGPIVTLGPAVRGQTTVRAAIGSGGAVWVAWSSQLLTEGGDNGPFEVRVAVRAARRAAFGRAVRLDSYARRASIEDGGVQLGLDSAGAGYLAWTGFDGANFRARLAALDPAGGSLRVTTLSAPGYDAVVGALAAGPRPGTALAVWSHLDTAGELGTQILAGLVTPAGYTGEETVSDADRARLPAAAFDPVGGEPTVAWTQRVGPDGPGVPIGQIGTVVRVATREAG